MDSPWDEHMKLWEKGPTLNLDQTWTKIMLTCDLRFHWTSFIGNSETTDFATKSKGAFCNCFDISK